MYSVSHFEHLWGMKRHNTRQGEISQDVYLSLLYEQKPHGVWSKWGTSTWNYTGHCPYSVTWPKAQMDKQEVGAEHPWSNLFHLGARGQEWRSCVGGKDSSWCDPACCSQSLGSGFASPAESCPVNVCSKSHDCVPTVSVSLYKSVSLWVKGLRNVIETDKSTYCFIAKNWSDPGKQLLELFFLPRDACEFRSIPGTWVHGMNERSSP